MDPGQGNGFSQREGAVLVTEELGIKTVSVTHKLSPKGMQRQFKLILCGEGFELFAIPETVTEGECWQGQAGGHVSIQNCIRLMAMNHTRYPPHHLPSRQYRIFGPQLAGVVFPTATMGLVFAPPGLARTVEVNAIQIVFSEQLVNAFDQPIGPAASGTGGVERLELSPARRC